jgi:hypothetical protein
MNSRKLVLTALAALWLIIGRVSHVAGEEPTIDFMLSGFKDSRERLREGSFRCRGVRIEDDPKTGRFEGEISIFCCFNYDAEKTRFDRVESVQASSKTEGGKPATKQQGGEVRQTARQDHPLASWRRCGDD